uniref:TM2 domain-containing protein 3 n=1 Tax=Callorhinchus milii TaxID=7868 RepID=V9L653_CALMI
MAAVSRSFELFLFVSQLHALLGGDSFSTKDPNRGLSAESSLLPTTILNTTPSTLPAGYREFQKKMYCNLTGGYKWSTALALSITLGGFGADRFYLGQWKEGLGKLFSFGGLGIWTLIDVLLIGIGYVGPADGSLYI